MQTLVIDRPSSVYTTLYISRLHWIHTIETTWNIDNGLNCDPSTDAANVYEFMQYVFL